MKKDKRFRDYPRAAELYEKGLSVEDIARYYGRTRAAMWQWMKSRKIKMRSNLRYRKMNNFYRGGKRASDRAQNILEKAIQKGLIERVPICEQCGARGKFKDGRTSIQAHHPDYNKPLDVMWLCQPCHHLWHKKNVPIKRR